jgi:hypothetical protein
MKKTGRMLLVVAAAFFLFSGFFALDKGVFQADSLAEWISQVKNNEWISSVLADDRLSVLNEKSARGDAHREAQKALEQWAAAMGRQNERTVEQWMEPENNKLIIRRLAVAPISHVKIKLTGAGNLETAQGEAVLKNVKAEIKYRYNGGKNSEEYPMIRSFDLLKRNGQPWKISNYRPVDQPALFEMGETKTRKSKNFLFLYHAQSEPQVEQIIEKTEQAYREIGKTLNADGNPPYPVLVYPKESMWQGGHTVATASGQYFINAAGYKVTNQFVSLNMEALEQSDEDDSVYTTLKHEIVHVYQFPQLPPYVPVWLLEGMAMYYSGDDMSYVFKGSDGMERLNEIDLTKLTASEKLGEVGFGVSGRKQQQEYAFSYCTVKYIIKTYGQEKLNDLIQSYSSTSWSAIEGDVPRDKEGKNKYKWEAVTTKLTNEYLQKHFGMSEKQLEEHVKQKIKQANIQ